MNKSYNFYIYIIASSSKTLYIGLTKSIQRRVFEHKEKLIEGFTKKYSCQFLVYYEHYDHIEDAINREKQLKKWNRNKKIRLIEKDNPNWDDLSNEF